MKINNNNHFLLCGKYCWFLNSTAKQPEPIITMHTDFYGIFGAHIRWVVNCEAKFISPSIVRNAEPENRALRTHCFCIIDSVQIRWQQQPHYKTEKETEAEAKRDVSILFIFNFVECGATAWITWSENVRSELNFCSRIWYVRGRERVGGDHRMRRACDSVS